MKMAVRNTSYFQYSLNRQKFVPKASRRRNTEQKKGEVTRKRNVQCFTWQGRKINCVFSCVVIFEILRHAEKITSGNFDLRKW